MGNYVTKEQIDNWPYRMSDEEQEAQIALAEETIEKALGKKFYEHQFSDHFSGNGVDYLDLGFQEPLINVTKVAKVRRDGSQSELGDYWFDDWAVRGQMFAHEGLAYLIEGTKGLAPTPAGIKVATKHYVRYLNDETEYDTYQRGRVSQGSLDVTDMRKPITGVEKVDEMLRHYTKKRITIHML